MQTKTPVTKAVKLADTAAGAVYATPTGLKVTARGKVHDPGYIYGALPKGDARKLRKAARAAGFTRHAAARRQPAA